MLAIFVCRPKKLYIFIGIQYGLSIHYFGLGCKLPSNSPEILDSLVKVSFFWRDGGSCQCEITVKITKIFLGNWTVKV